MGNRKKQILRVLIVLCFGLVPTVVSQFFLAPPSTRKIHMKSFRYGKDPSVIRVNRGDTLKLTFSTDDTGHSFFLEEFDIDAKVSPARETVEVFKASDPTDSPVLTKELVFIAKHKGLRNYLVSKSNYRCHVWCGPMHAFEHGKLIILPNTLLVFSLGCLAGIVLIWILGLYSPQYAMTGDHKTAYRDLLKNKRIRNLVTSRWPQIILMLLAMALVYVVILTSIFGTKMSGRNLGVLLMWAIWLFLLVALLTPFLGRIWCTICPLPFFGDLIQRGSVFTPEKGTKDRFKNRFNGLFLKWPKALRNDWPKLIMLLALTTFSTTLVAIPKVTGFAVILLLLLPTVMAPVFELRAFCRYLCPVSGFIGPYSRMSGLALRNKSQRTCDRCKPEFCQNGSEKGWACPYGLNVGELNENTDCGLCLECTRSCLYNNVTLYARPFAVENGTKGLSQAWLTIGIFTLSIVYSVLYQGHWPVVRDYVNILDKGNWDLFGIYALIVWTSALVVMPGILYFGSFVGSKASSGLISTRELFLRSAGALLPMGLMLWISFVIPMLFVNITFVLQSLSDPFGWGWDFFGTASIPWHQFLPGLVPWIQSVLILTGLYLSLRNLNRNWDQQIEASRKLKIILPVGILFTLAAFAMILFYTN